LEITLEVFRACLPARGAKARDDRLFLEALHFFVVHNITWRALPERFGRWNSVWKRFDRLSKAGTFEDFFALLAGLSNTAHLVQMFPFRRLYQSPAGQRTVQSFAHMSQQQAQKGAVGSGPRAVTRRVRNENPFENRP